MTLLTNARILHRTWATHFDPSAPILDRASSSTQEAWLLVAANAKILSASPDPAPLITPGHLYLATWNEHDSWKGNAPRRPAIAFKLPNYERFFAIFEERNESPISIAIEAPPSSVREIPGLIYDLTPL